MKSNQFGRSMMEMLGVLAIVGVLSVGGLDMISKSRRNNQTAELLSGVSDMAGTLLQSRKYAAEIASNTGYNGNCVKFLKQAGKIPNALNYDSSTGTLTSAVGATVSAQADSSGTFIISVSGVDREICIKMASADWGNFRTNRFIGVSVGSASGFASNSSNKMAVAAATTACSSATSNTVNLGYKF